MHRFTRSALAGAALAFTALASPAVTLVGLTSQNQLTRFDSATPGTASTVAITGLAAGDRFVGIDLRPKDNKIYGVTLSNQIYTVDEATGATTLVAALSSNVINPALGYGIDFNPVADFGAGASLRLLSSAGSNFAINASTGLVGNTTSNIGGGFTGAGYSNSTPLPSAAPASTALYYLNSNTDTLMLATANFNAPSISTVGALGVDVLKANGFEVLPDGSAYAALNVDDGSSLLTGLYSINLGTGAATLLGTVNGTLSGLTVSAVPEPQTWALMLAGLAAVAWLPGRARRRTAGAA